MHKLSKIERCQIETLHAIGKQATDIAKQLGRSVSTITREISRNSVEGKYTFELADVAAKSRRGQHNKSKISSDNWTYVRTLLRQKWSPEQIDGWLKRHVAVGFTMSRESIYQYIKEDRDGGGDLYLNLRRAGKAYNYGRFKQYRGKIKGRIDITHRPDIVNKRLRIGDWEVDSVIGSLHKSSIVTLVERVSRYTSIIKVDSKEADGVADAIVDKCKKAKLLIKTITGDNGLEFSAHDKIAKQLGIDFYFTHPYCSWEKGTNENTNGLIRQYFPKGTDFNLISQKMIDKVGYQYNPGQDCLLNNQPQ